MTTLVRHRIPIAPLLALAGAIAIVAGVRLVGSLPARNDLGLDEPLLDAPAGAVTAVSAADELDQARSDVVFWANRLTARADAPAPADGRWPSQTPRRVISPPPSRPRRPPRPR